MATQIEVLAAILMGSPRRPIKALITETYVMLNSDKAFSSVSMNIPIDRTGAYLDTQDTSVSDFFMEVLNIVITQDQKPDVLFSNLTTGAGLAVVRTITTVTQDQKEEVLLSNLTTGSGLAVVRTIIKVIQDQKEEILFSNLTTGAGSATVTTP